jgi:hypothetical protein
LPRGAYQSPDGVPNADNLYPNIHQARSSLLSRYHVQSPDSYRHFVGGGWVTQSHDDLELASQFEGASSIQQSTAPGGGYFVDLKDPNGTNIRLVHGIEYRKTEEQQCELPKPVIFNSWVDKPRKGQFQRFETGPSKVHKLGHYGMTVDKSKFATTLGWYIDHFNFAPSDSLYDVQSGMDMMTFLHLDKGEEFVDHHVSQPQYLYGSLDSSFYMSLLMGF